MAVALAAVGGVAAARESEPLEVSLFARVPAPGSPEGIAVDSRGTVFVGTSPKQGGPLGNGPRSKIFAYDSRGRLGRAYEIEGQDLTDPFYGLVGMAFDGADRLYAADAAPPRIIRLNPDTGGQHDYVRFPDVPPCSSTVAIQCSDTVRDLPPLPDYPVFSPDGTLYVTDLNQALIWRVPRGGGRAEVWFTERGFESLFGPNGAQFLADGRTLLFVLSTQSSPLADPQRAPGLYSIPVRRDGSPGAPRQLWASSSSDVPDGFALSRSGRAYVALAGTSGNAVAVISPDGRELARTPASEIENQMMEVPFDQPASTAFLSKRLLVTNHALFSRNPDHFAVLEVFAGESGLALFRPRVGVHPGIRPRLSLRPRHVVVGRRICFRFRATLPGRLPLARARIRFASEWTRTGARGRTSICKRFRRAGSRTATLRKRGYPAVRVRVRVRQSPDATGDRRRATSSPSRP